MNEDETQLSINNNQLDDETVINNSNFAIDTEHLFEEDDNTDIFIKDENTKQTINKIFIKNPIKELIKKYKLLENNELENLEKSNSLNLTYLIDSYLIDVDKLYKLLSTEFNMRFYNKIDTLTNNINDDLIDISTQRKMGILIVFMTTRDGNDEYFILISNPFDYEQIDYIKTIINKDIKINFALGKAILIKKTILKYMQEGDIKLEFSLDSNSSEQMLNLSEIEDIQY
jgi:hypothetical protein